MGFIDNFKNGYHSESEKINESRERNWYKTVEEREREHSNRYARYDNGALMRKLGNSDTPDEDKRVIASLLKSRGYNSEVVDNALD